MRLFYKNALVKAGTLIGGAALTALKAGIPAIITGLTLGAAESTLEKTAKEKDKVGEHKSAAFARILAAGNKRASQMAPIGMIAGSILPGAGTAAGGVLFGGVGEIEGMAEEAYNEYTQPKPNASKPKIPKGQHHGRERLGHTLPHYHKSWYDELFGVTPAEGAELDQQFRQPKHLKHEGRNKLGHHGKELKVEGDLKVSPEKDIAINAKEAKNVTILVGSEAIAKIVKDTIAGMILGGAAGSVLPGPGNLAGMGVGGATGLAMNSGILSKLTGKDFEEFKKKFKEGLEKGETINTH